MGRVIPAGAVADLPRWARCAELVEAPFLRWSPAGQVARGDVIDAWGEWVTVLSVEAGRVWVHAAVAGCYVHAATVRVRTDVRVDPADPGLQVPLPAPGGAA